MFWGLMPSEANSSVSALPSWETALLRDYSLFSDRSDVFFLGAIHDREPLLHAASSLF